MMSTAYYPTGPEAPGGVLAVRDRYRLRGDLGFDGVVVSDDLARARQVASFSPGGRALRFVRAGGDLLLSVDPGRCPRCTTPCPAARSAAFRAKVDAAVLRVLRVKQQQGPAPRHF